MSCREVHSADCLIPSSAGMVYPLLGENCPVKNKGYMALESERVADGVPNSWVYRLLPAWLWPYAQLARWERPIGWWLLLWPCWWMLAIAVQASPPHLIVTHSDPIQVFVLSGAFAAFLMGAIAMRGAGCTYNDLVDEDIDAAVSRTASRPIPSGRVSRGSAKTFIWMQLGVGGLALVYLSTFRGNVNGFALLLAFSSLLVVAIYPFAKRVTNWPQLVLGLAFSWGALMGWAVVFGSLSMPALLFYVGCICWVIGYDTIYAHQDREDDALVGVRSTARLFGEHTATALVILYVMALAAFAGTLFLVGDFLFGWISLLAGGLHLGWQIRQLDINDSALCLKLFQSNHRFGLIFFSGLIADLML